MKKYLAFDIHVFNHENQIIKLQRSKCKMWIPEVRYEQEQATIRKNLDEYLTDEVTQRLLSYIKR